MNVPPVTEMAQMAEESTWPPDGLPQNTQPVEEETGRAAVSVQVSGNVRSAARFTAVPICCVPNFEATFVPVLYCSQMEIMQPKAVVGSVQTPVAVVNR